MRFELSRSRKRREILAAPELLRIEPEMMKMSLLVITLVSVVVTLLCFMVLPGMIFGGFDTIFIPFIGSVIAVTFILVIARIVQFNRKPLIFTQVGIAGGWMFCARYDELGTYQWENYKGIFPILNKAKKTLLITLNKGIFRDFAYTARGGGSILGACGYFFDTDQIKSVEKILDGFGVQKASTG